MRITLKEEQRLRELYAKYDALMPIAYKDEISEVIEAVNQSAWLKGVNAGEKRKGISKSEGKLWVVSLIAGALFVVDKNGFEYLKDKVQQKLRGKGIFDEKLTYQVFSKEYNQHYNGERIRWSSENVVDAVYAVLDDERIKVRKIRFKENADYYVDDSDRGDNLRIPVFQRLDVLKGGEEKEEEGFRVMPRREEVVCEDAPFAEFYQTPLHGGGESNMSTTHTVSDGFIDEVAEADGKRASLDCLLKGLKDQSPARALVTFLCNEDEMNARLMLEIGIAGENIESIMADILLHPSSSDEEINGKKEAFKRVLDIVADADDGKMKRQIIVGSVKGVWKYGASESEIREAAKIIGPFIKKDDLETVQKVREIFPRLAGASSRKLGNGDSQRRV